MLTSADSVKTILGIAAGDTSQDGILGLCVGAADQAVKSYTKRELELAIFTQVYSTRGEDKLALRQRPVWQFSLSAVLVEGSADAEVAAGAGNLVAAMPAVAEGYLPVGTTISSVSGTTVTLSSAVTQSGTITVHFGLAVWLDTQALGGQASNPFDDGTFLFPGAGGYVLDLDNLNVSKSGLLIRSGGTSTGDWWGSGWGFWGGYGRRGTLTARLPPAWPVAAGCVKAVFAAGYYPDAIPADLQMAVTELAIHLNRTAPFGGVQLPQSESYRNYAYSLGVQALAGEPAMGSVRQLLSRYRELAL